MKTMQAIFAKPVSIEDLETRFKTALLGAISFLTESCCIDTQPPLPPGA